MTRGLLKSITLHLGILFAFMYGAEIFKKNKRFEIYEIPLDIVDVSEETINKLENTKQKTKKTPSQKNQFFSPPKPKSRPKNPEFALKEKKKDKKVEKTKVEEKIEKSKQKKDRMDSILKSIEKVKSENQKISENKEDEQPQEKEKEVKELSLGEKLSISEKDAIRRQFYRCWIVPAGAKNLKELVVSIKIKLNREGEVIFSKIINDKMIGNNTFFRTASESAMRAVNHPECKKLKVPKKKYDTWNEIILDFDPSQSLN